MQALFSINPLNRMDALRESIDDLRPKLPIAQQRFILISGEDLILQNNERDYLFSYDEIKSLGINNEDFVFLGVNEEIYYFAKAFDPLSVTSLKRNDLRSFATINLGNDHSIGMLAQAFSILKWHETHRFCPACGVKTVLTQGGWRQNCPACAKEHFPRTDPVVIMLVTYEDSCLLGSGLNFPHQVYSCLAGFMEPGESIEDAARRELSEEAGVQGLDVHYMASQAWPFPFSLMIGLHVYAKDKVLTINHAELADARWIKKSEVAAVLNGATDRNFSLPSRITIARNMLEEWVSGKTP